MEDAGRNEKVLMMLEEMEECGRCWKEGWSVEDVERNGGVWRMLEEME